MKKLFYILLLLIFINPVSAYSLTNSVKTNESTTYENNTVNNFYVLDSTDIFEKIRHEYKLTYDKLPFTVTYRLNDSLNNVLAIRYDYSRESCFFVLNCYRQNVTVFKNNINIPIINWFEKEGINSLSGLSNPIFTNQFDIGSTFEIYLDHIIIKDVGSLKNNVELNNTYYFMFLQIPNNVNYSYYSSYINIKYIDSGKSKLKFAVDKKYSQLWFPFQFLFMIFTGVLKSINLATFGTIINDDDIINLQDSFSNILLWLSFTIFFIIGVIQFIFTMGILWFALISELLIFIYAYVSSPQNDLFYTLNRFFEISINFWNIVFIKPLLWLYEKVIAVVIGYR